MPRSFDQFIREKVTKKDIEPIIKKVVNEMGVDLKEPASRLNTSTLTDIADLGKEKGFSKVGSAPFSFGTAFWKYLQAWAAKVGEISEDELPFHIDDVNSYIVEPK